MSDAISRRRFLRFVAAAPVAAAAACAGRRAEIPGLQVERGVRLNDVHSRLNPTRVDRLIPVDSTAAVQRVIGAARAQGVPIAISGSRHSMGGQQFLTDGWVLDARPLRHVRNFDTINGHLRVDAGMEWPQMLEFLSTTWDENGQGWTFLQKQIGADHLTIGGAVAANVHGHPLAYPPFIEDVERLVVVDYDGVPRTASRDENLNLFRLTHGGYGLSGVITEVTLRLIPRRKLERIVTEEQIEDIAVLMRDRATMGHLYGEFLFSVNQESYNDFLRRGILVTYARVPGETPIPSDQRTLSEEEKRDLLIRAHNDPYSAMRRTIDYHLATNGQIYWADLVQLAGYEDDRHAAVEQVLGGPPSSEVLTELYVPRDQLAGFMAAARALLRTGTPVVHGNVRFVDTDDLSFLPWATSRFACVTLELHVVHTREAIDRATGVVRELIDEALERGGSFSLAYHRWATAEQVQRAYPRFDEFLRLKQVYDPENRFQSDWFRFYRDLFV